MFWTRPWPGGAKPPGGDLPPPACRRGGPLRDFTATTTNTTYAGDITYSAVLVVCAGRDSSEAARRANVIRRDVDELPDQTPLFAFGTPARIVDRLGSFAEAGVQRVYLQLLDLTDSDHLELISTQVANQLRGE